MLKRVTFEPSSLRGQVSEEEWEARVELAACYRLMARYGMTDLIYNHITVRVPGTDDQFLINPFGAHYSEITASSLFKIDLEGKTVLRPDVPYEINLAGYVIHSAIHSARHDVDCIIHTHTRAGMAISAMKCGLLPLNQTALRFYNRLSFHDYEGPAIDPAEKSRLINDLGKNDAMVLRNHGLLVCARSVAEAFNMIYWLEMACKTQIDTLAGGFDNLELPSPEVAEHAARLYDPGVRRVLGLLEWDSLIRQLDREAPGYDS